MKALGLSLGGRGSCWVVSEDCSSGECPKSQDGEQSMECFGRTDFLIKKTLQTWTGTGNEEHFTLFHCTSLDAGVFLSAQLSFHGKPASFSFRYHPKHGGSLSHARGVAQEIQPIFRCSNGAEDVHPYQSEDDTHRYSLDVQKKTELSNYLCKSAIYDYLFFFVMFNPTIVFFKGHIVGQNPCTTWDLTWDVQTPQQTLGDLPGNCWQLRNIQGQKRLEEALQLM